MNKIKFSHRYTKTPEEFQQSRLLDVIPIKLEDLSSDFHMYDTAYREGNTYTWYPPPLKGSYMILLLYSKGGRLWTTIRSQKGINGIDKLAYYRSKIGEILHIKNRQSIRVHCYQEQQECLSSKQ